jgi:DNA-binding NarL/FixJ family response regulator
VPIAVVLIDDHDLIRQGLRRAFEMEPEFEVRGEAGSIAAGEKLVAETTPDVAIVDLRLPDGTGLDLVRTLRNNSSTIGLVVLTMYAGDEHLFGALEAGASAFVPKDAAADEVIAAARHAAASPLAFSAADLADAMRRRLAPTGPQLSPRENEVLQLLAEGLAVSGIARRLFISESTAKTHISKVYEKLGAGNRAQAIMTAVRQGLVKSHNKDNPDLSRGPDAPG